MNDIIDYKILDSSQNWLQILVSKSDFLFYFLKKLPKGQIKSLLGCQRTGSVWE